LNHKQAGFGRAARASQEADAGRALKHWFVDARADATAMAARAGVSAHAHAEPGQVYPPIAAAPLNGPAKLIGRQILFESVGYANSSPRAM
jgi:hypothetical protein